MGFGSGGLWLGIVFSTLERWPGEEYLCMSRIFAAYSVGALVGPGLGAIGGIRRSIRHVPRARRVRRSSFRPSAGRPGTSSVSDRPDRTSTTGLLGGRDSDHRRDPWNRACRWRAAAALFLAPLTVRDRRRLRRTGRRRGVRLGRRRSARPRTSHSDRRRATRSSESRSRERRTSSPLGWLRSRSSGRELGSDRRAATGLLLEAVPGERIISAMVVWSQMAMIGYLVAPIAGGALGQSLGYGSLGILPAAMVAVLVCAVYARKQGLKRSQAA